jgi:hypothetical protein
MIHLFTLSGGLRFQFDSLVYVTIFQLVDSSIDVIVKYNLSPVIAFVQKSSPDNRAIITCQLHLRMEQWTWSVRTRSSTTILSQRNVMYSHYQTLDFSYLDCRIIIITRGHFLKDPLYPAEIDYFNERRSMM